MSVPGPVEVVVVEKLGNPGVDVGEDGFFSEVDRFGVVAAVDGIVRMDLAAVVGLGVGPGAFHASTAFAAADQAGEYVRPRVGE